jgi:hypothetical protein
MNFGLTANRFTQINTLGALFQPTVTYNQDGVSAENEYVAMVEGISFPFFGFAYSPDKVLYNYDYDLEDIIDFSRRSIKHAQFLANFFVDEAKLSNN